MCVDSGGRVGEGQSCCTGEGCEPQRGGMTCPKGDPNSLLALKVLLPLSLLSFHPSPSWRPSLSHGPFAHKASSTGNTIPFSSPLWSPAHLARFSQSSPSSPSNLLSLSPPTPLPREQHILLHNPVGDTAGESGVSGNQCLLQFLVQTLPT